MLLLFLGMASVLTRAAERHWLKKLLLQENAVGFGKF